MEDPAIIKAREALAAYVDGRPGSKTAVAEELGVAQVQLLHQWMTIRTVPAGRAAQMERRSHGALKVEVLRPDLSWLRVDDSDWPGGMRPVHDVAATA